MSQGYEENLKRQRENLLNQKKSLSVSQAWLAFTSRLADLDSLTPEVLREIASKSKELADIIEELDQLDANS